MVADRMIGIDWIEAEIDVRKIRRVHPDWWIALSANGIHRALDIIDAVEREVGASGPLDQFEMCEIVARLYKQRRLEEAEAKILTPRGWKLDAFNQYGRQVIPEALYTDLSNMLDRFEFTLQLLVAGFDKEKKGCIFSIEGDSERGMHIRHDIPGFYAVGSGGAAANYMMYYRSLGPSLPLREAMFYALEAKWFGEQAAGVGADTDFYIMRQGWEQPIELDEEATTEKIFFDKLCKKLGPQRMRPAEMDLLDSVPELKDESIFPPLDRVALNKRQDENYWTIKPTAKKLKGD
jgi:hypothetical protein